MSDDTKPACPTCDRDLWHPGHVCYTYDDLRRMRAEGDARRKAVEAAVSQMWPPENEYERTHVSEWHPEDQRIYRESHLSLEQRLEQVAVARQQRMVTAVMFALAAVEHPVPPPPPPTPETPHEAVYGWTVTHTDGGGETVYCLVCEKPYFAAHHW